MKNLKSILAAVAVAAVAIAPQVQAATPPGHAPTFPGTTGQGTSPGNRTLKFTPNAAFSTASNGDGETTYDATSHVSTVVHVRSYLYVSGQLGGEWDVDGWGDGTLTTPAGQQYLDIYHSDPFLFTSTGWGDPIALAANNPTGQAAGHSIPMTFEGTFKDADGGAPLYTVPAGTSVSWLNSLNGVNIKPDVTSGGLGPTQGHLDMDFTATLKPNEATYSGTYTMNPTVTFTNN